MKKYFINAKFGKLTLAASATTIALLFLAVSGASSGLDKSMPKNKRCEYTLLVSGFLPNMKNFSEFTQQSIIFDLQSRPEFKSAKGIDWNGLRKTANTDIEKAQKELTRVLVDYCVKEVTDQEMNETIHYFTKTAGGRKLSALGTGDWFKMAFANHYYALQKTYYDLATKLNAPAKADTNKK